MGSYCMVCGKKKKGIRVMDDHVLRAMRWFKRNVTRNVQDNELVVCRSCYPEYSKMRKRYVGRRTAYIALGVLFLVFSVILSLNSFNGAAIAIGILMIFFLYLLSLVSYVPALDIKRAVKRR